MAYVNVAEWKPEQVTEWLKGLDNAILAYVYSFLNNEVNGQQLLNIRPDDLDHLGVQKLGHQELILEAVEHLRNFHYELDRENLQLLALRLSCRARSLYKELVYHEDSEPVSTQTLADVASIMTTVKPIACWLGRSPFAGHSDYHHRKISLLNLSLEIATCAHRDRFAERPVEEIRKSCDQLASLADSIIRDIQDPLLLQPASLDLATVKKKAGEDLGFFIQPSFHGIHQISELKFSSPAQQCGKIEEGDEVVQVNYQTVVGWQSKKVMFLLEESLTDVFLTLKKRPRHTKVYGQIYIKPYRLPSKKRATPYTRWHENLPSPRPELLTIPDFEIPLPRSSPKPRMVPPVPEHLIDSEPLACSSSSGDDDEDDGAFLPGGTDIVQASPTSMRLYLPKQRSSVQRRATVTGASPTSRRPPVNIEQLWRELQLEHQVRGTGHNSGVVNAELCQLREKSHGISGSLVSVNDMIRPSTCLGIEQTMNNSFNLSRPKYSKEKKIMDLPIEGMKKDEDLVVSKNFRELSSSASKNVLGLRPKKTETEFENSKTEVDNSISLINVNEDNKNSSEMNCQSTEISNETISNNIFSPNLSSTLKNYSKTNYSDSTFSLTFCTKVNNDISCEEVSENGTENNTLFNHVWPRENEKVHQNAIDENALKIPYGNMKYIDDTSDTNLSKDYADECDIPLSVDRSNFVLSESSNTAISNENSHHNYCIVDCPSNFPEFHGKFQDEVCSPTVKKKHKEFSDFDSGKTASNQEYMPSSHSFIVGEPKKCYNAEDSMQMYRSNPPNKSNTLELPRRNVHPKHIISVKNKIEGTKKSVNLTASNNNNNSGSMNFNPSNMSSNTNISYRNKLAQSLGQFGGSKTLPSSMWSPKSLKRRNILLAKRRNVNPKELGPADCEGWLLHRCRWNGSGASLGTTWTRAWFILKGSIFYGFKSPHVSKANIMISLPGFTVSVAEEVKSKKFSFKVYHTGTVFYFAAESDQLLASWLESITLGTIAQDTGKSFSTEDIFFSETEEDSEPEAEIESGTCFPNRRTYKFSNLLGGNSSPTVSHSQQNLSSETKFGQEVQKKFGSLKKLGRKVTDVSGSSHASHSDGGSGSSSLDRKYLCFLGSSRNNTIPVPTAQFRSYRRVPNTTSSKSLNDSSHKGCESTLKGDSLKEFSKKVSSGTAGTRVMQSMESTKQFQEKVRSTNYSNLVSIPNYNVGNVKDKEYINPIPYKSQNCDRFLRPIKIGDLRERSTHASNPTLQLSGDLSDYRLAAERLREFNVQRNRPREDTSGFVTLEEFMLSRQEEEKKSQTFRNRGTDLQLNTDSSNTSLDPKKSSNFNAIDSSKKSIGSIRNTHSPQLCPVQDKMLDNTYFKHVLDSRCNSNQLKSVAQYQPPPVAQLEDGQPLTLAFEMHLGEKESHNTKSSKFRSIFGSKSNRQNSQKQNQLEVPLIDTPEPRQKTLLGSPRLHRAIFRDKHNSANKGSRSDSPCSSISSPISPPTPSQNEWAVESPSDISPSQSKPTMGISMLGKRPSRRAPMIYAQVQSSPSVSPPDYPGLEYPPVFEPETYTLADASSLRSRPRTQSEKPT